MDKLAQDRQPLTLDDVIYMDVGKQVYTAEGRMPWMVSYLEFFDLGGNEVTWRDKPIACRMFLVVPKRSFDDGGRRRAGERLVEGSFAIVYTEGLSYMYTSPPPRKPRPVLVEVDDTHDEIWMPEGHKYHGSNGPLY